MTTTGVARRSMARNSARRGGSRPAPWVGDAMSGGDGGVVGAFVGPRLGEQPLGEIEPLGQLGHFAAQGVELQEDFPSQLRIAGGLFRVPTGDQSPVRIAEGPARDEDQVIEVPDTE